jgi:DNA (cytosine-5)-methyltransferase 1
MRRDELDGHGAYVMDAVAFQQNSRSEVRLIGGDGNLVGAITAEPGAQQQNYIAFPSRLSSTQAQETMRPNISPALTRLNPMAVADSRSVGTWWDGGQTCQTIDAVVAKGQMMPEKNRFPVVAVGEKSCLPANATTTEIAQDAELTTPSVDVLGQLRKSNMSTAKTQVESSGRVKLRRLTPREWERLQGFPDDYTLIPYRGKAAEDCPDGPRYKALGNSMAVPCMRWIGERIAAAN